jgi:hypothetical protein
MKEQREREARNDELDRQIEGIKASLNDKAEPLKKKILEQRLAQLPQAVQDDLRKTLATAPEQRTEVQKYLAEKFEKLLTIDSPDMKNADPEYRRAATEAEKGIKLLETQKEPEPRVRALWDRGDPSPTYILRRGDPTNYGAMVGPGVPSALTDGKTSLEVKPPWPGAHKSGRRLAFAQWLIRSDNPLTSRVMVNRIWAHHFGQGIVKTLGNFGHTGAPPTHPELLDWLATEFVRQGWSIKAMHRLMMTSSTYRQGSRLTPALERADPENQLLTRMPLKRMEAEVLYDTLVYLSGRLDETPFGPPEPVLARGDGLVTPIETEKGWRRSVYVQQRRTEIPTMLETFDLPAMSPNCLERSHSTVALQALVLMNDSMVRDLAGYFARKIEQQTGGDPRRHIERAYWMALGRPPTEEEKKVSSEVLARLVQAEGRKQPAELLSADRAQTSGGPARIVAPGNDPPLKEQTEAASKALKKFCQSLFNSAAFLYID